MSTIMTFTNLILRLNTWASTVYKKNFKKLSVDYEILYQLTIVRDAGGCASKQKHRTISQIL